MSTKKLEQKKFCYTFSPLNDPVIKITPGETIVASFPDWVEGRIKTENDRIPNLMTPSLSEVNWNPTAGPIYVEGAEKGDALSAKIVDINIDASQGNAVYLPTFDDLSVALLNFSDYKIRICPIKDGKVSFGDGVEVPVTPNIDCIGTAPMYGAISTADLGRQGEIWMFRKHVREPLFLFPCL